MKCPNKAVTAAGLAGKGTESCLQNQILRINTMNKLLNSRSLQCFSLFTDTGLHETADEQTTTTTKNFGT